MLAGWSLRVHKGQPQKGDLPRLGGTPCAVRKVGPARRMRWPRRSRVTTELPMVLIKLLKAAGWESPPILPWVHRGQFRSNMDPSNTDPEA